jgi:integrase
MQEISVEKYTSVDIEDLMNKAKMVLDMLDVSIHTRRDYKQRIGMFVEYTSNHGFDRNTFLEFKRTLASREDLTVATKNKYLATARIFLKELYRLGFIPADITTNIRSFNQSSKHKREGLNHDEVERIVRRVHDLPNTGRNTRLKALLCLLVLQGLRQIEITRLNVHDLDLVAGKAYVQGKGRDDKEAVHLLPETVKAIRLYMRTNKVASGGLFKSLGNRKCARISTMTIKREIGALFDAEDITKTVHGLRHYYITTLLGQFDVRDVRKFSRHKTLEMLIVYDDEIDISHKAEEVAKCFQGFNVA